MSAMKRSLGVTLALLCSGCTVGPDFVRPDPAAPAHWSPEATAAPTATALPAPASTVSEQSTQLSAWWNAFNDPALGSLVERAVGSNLDLRVAMVRIEESRAQRDISAAGLWPTLAAEASYSRTRLSETTPTGELYNSVGSFPLPAGDHISIPNPYNQYQLS